MANKKVVILALVLLLTINLSFLSAFIDIKTQEISSMSIPELKKPAIFNLEVTNKGENDSFNIYSLVGIDLEPKESFYLSTGETKKMVLSITPTAPLRVSPDYISFEYKIKGQKAGIKTDQLSIIVVELKDAFNFYIDSINPESTKAKIHFENKAGYNLDKIQLQISSAFFTKNIDLSLTPLEKKEIEVDLDKAKMKELFAGPYIVNANIVVEGVEAETSTILKFEEKPGIETKETNEGVFLNRYEIEKNNKGNVKTEVTTVVSKNLFSSLFTRFNVLPTKKEVSGFKINYIFIKELSPGESLDIIVKTNWWVLIAVIAGIIIIIYLFQNYIRNKLVLKKRVSFVRAKGGEFALKVTLHIKARDFIEKIRIFDRLPPMVKVFENFGLSSPDKIDEQRRRLEWNINALSRGEERTLSYIIYSKMGIVGKFELPQAGAIYEFQGNIKEAESNRAYYINEPGTSSN